MKYLYIRNSSFCFSRVVKIHDDFVDYDEFLPLAIKHAIKNGYAIFNDRVFSCWDNLDNNI